MNGMIKADEPDGTSGINAVWQKFRRGDMDSFAYFYNLHFDTLFRYGCHLSRDEELVRDAIQEIFIDLYYSREKIRSGPENLKYYLILALKRYLIRRLTRGRRQVDDADILRFEADYQPDTLLIEKERQSEILDKVDLLLSQLPDKQKEAIYLRFNESMEYSDIAEIMEISVESVRKQVYRALKTIKEIVDIKGIVLFFHFVVKKNTK
ncbi:MAG: RNA polymerase sigma factor [Bacteroidota bacterium]